MTFNECKDFLFKFYSKDGFEKVVIDKETCWMLQDENRSNAYINLTNKNDKIKLELFNVKATFDITYFQDIEVIQNIDGELKNITKENSEGLNQNISYEEIQKIKDSIFLTTETMTDMSIEKRIKIISTQRIYGINLVKDLFAFIRDIVGGRVDSLEKALSDANKEILEEMKEECYKCNGDAVISVKIEHTYNNANNGSILSVFATGTVIKIKGAKINCYECNKSILKSESTCPHCGSPQQ